MTNSLFSSMMLSASLKSLGSDYTTKIGNYFITYKCIGYYFIVTRKVCKYKSKCLYL